ncbi:MAG: hypothetical protein LBR32_06820 [Propionibacteriaceae bacterium]|jgi:hypothetical protein|nr:hypothetical protein [Propionibacteriaceae bacterium]
MACFTAPTAAALIAWAAKRHVGKTGGKSNIPLRAKLGWLVNMMGGGALLLALEHIWHGEVVFYPPFLTAMASPAETAAMWAEIGTVGVTMVGIVLVAWAAMVVVAENVAGVRKALGVSA